MICTDCQQRDACDFAGKDSPILEYCCDREGGSWRFDRIRLERMTAERDRLAAELLAVKGALDLSSVRRLSQIVIDQRRENDRIIADRDAMQADGMPSDRDALQALLDSAYNKGRDDVHALYQTGAPIALLQGELLAVREELGRVRSALETMLIPVDSFGNHGGTEWGYRREHAQNARAALSQPTKTGGDA